MEVKLTMVMNTPPMETITEPVRQHIFFLVLYAPLYCGYCCWCFGVDEELFYVSFEFLRGQGVAAVHSVTR